MIDSEISGTSCIAAYTRSQSTQRFHGNNACNSITQGDVDCQPQDTEYETSCDRLAKQVSGRDIGIIDFESSIPPSSLTILRSLADPCSKHYVGRETASSAGQADFGSGEKSGFFFASRVETSTTGAFEEEQKYRAIAANYFKANKLCSHDARWFRSTHGRIHG